MSRQIRTLITLIIFVCMFTSCSSLRNKEGNMHLPNEVGFTYFEKDFLLVKVLINGNIEGNFILDTGIGITLISKLMCKKINCSVSGEHVGKRMSGQEVTLPMSLVKSLSLAGKTETNFPVGIFDVEKLMPGSNIDGFLSLGFFKNFPHTVVYNKQTIRFENEDSLKGLRTKGTVVNVSPDQKGESFTVMMPLVLPNGEAIKAEVDTGSQSLILHERYMNKLNISQTDPKVKRKDAKDETGHSYARFFTTLNGPVHLLGAEDMKLESPSVMFQKIIYDGLVGFYFLREFDVTYDLRSSQMIFNRPTN